MDHLLDIIRVRTRLGDTCVGALGPVDAHPVILMEGLAAGPLPFGLALASLGKAFRVFSVPVAGSAGDIHGRPLLEDAYGPSWLGDVLDGLGLPRASLVGLSRGARTVSQFASLQPGRVDRVALLSPVGVLPQKWSLLASLRAGGRDLSAGRPWLGSAALRGIAAPTLLLVGARDGRLSRPSLLNAARRALPNLVLAAIVPEAGHALHLDQPGAVGGVLTDFLIHGGDWCLAPDNTHSSRAI